MIENMEDNKKPKLTREQRKKARKEKKLKKQKEKNPTLVADQMAANLIQKNKSNKDAIDSKTGLTITPTSNDKEKSKDAQKLEAYKERQAKKAAENKITSVTKQVPQTPDGRVIKRGSDGMIKVSDEKATSTQSEKLTRGGEKLDSEEVSDRNEDLARARGLSRENFSKQGGVPSGKTMPETMVTPNVDNVDVPSPTGISPKENKKLLKKNKKSPKTRSK